MCHLGHTGSIWIFTSTKKAVSGTDTNPQMKKVVTFRILFRTLMGMTCTASEACPNVTPVDTENFDENGVPEPGI